MLIKVKWINFHKESELDRPEMFQRFDEIELDDNVTDNEALEKVTKEKLSTQFDLPSKKIQIIEFHTYDEAKS
ncbi:hypothetical protein [Thalassobacillus devorans]|uniref:hypothetical protein n=1 Tax=Thalassobacillus devorans TaxID=279813 RepID=UPI000A1CCEBF|nr:hypothetical protein [Thalassobacillus devorans]